MQSFIEAACRCTNCRGEDEEGDEENDDEDDEEDQREIFDPMIGETDWFKNHGEYRFTEDLYDQLLGHLSDKGEGLTLEACKLHRKSLSFTSNRFKYLRICVQLFAAAIVGISPSLIPSLIRLANIPLKTSKSRKHP